MNQKQLFEISKKLLIFSAKKGEVSSGEKKKIIPQLEGILIELQNDTSPIALRIQIFITDILSDIEHNRPIDIDIITEDNYLENFFLAEDFVVVYNNLLKRVEYNSIIHSIKNKNFHEAEATSMKLQNRVKNSLNKIDTQRISELLLIVNIFHISGILEYYAKLYGFVLEYNDIKTAQIIGEIISIIRIFHTELHFTSMKCINIHGIESKYMVGDIQNNKISFFPVEVVPENKKLCAYKKVLLEKFPL